MNENNYPFLSIPLPSRSTKPRSSGITHVLDKTLGPQGLHDLLSLAGQHIDILKLGWGTSRVTPATLIQEKIKLCESHQVLTSPGGTLLELAVLHGTVEEVMAECRELGFSCIEVSDGTIDLDHARKLDIIRRARDMGFIVLSEVGKKSSFADSVISFEQRTGDIEQELEAGSTKVIIEARECGNVGIYNNHGSVIHEFVENLLEHIDLDDLIFEAPQATQQLWLIKHLGNSVNIGNVAPEGALNLETLRCGLRSDTLLRYHAELPLVHIENGPEGAERAAARGDVVIVVDVLRASSTIITALAAGIGRVVPVRDLTAHRNDLTAGERLGEKLPEADFDNSPLAFSEREFHGESLALSSTNGSECIARATQGAAAVLIGAMINVSAVADRARKLSMGRGISLVMGGRRGALAPEDLLTASRIIESIGECKLEGEYRILRSNDITRDFLASGSGENLSRLGRRDDVIFCASVDRYESVPEWIDNSLQLHSTGSL